MLPLLQNIVSSRQVQSLFENPGQVAPFLERFSLLFVLKVVFLILFLVYVIFAITAFLQVKRLQGWILHLSKYHYSKIVLIHLLLAVVGFALAFFVL